MSYIILFGVLLLVLFAYIQIAKQLNITDKPNNRSSHTKITVRGGGIIFPISTIIWFVASGFQFPLFCLGLICISLISFLDDIFQLSNRIRLVFQFLSIVLLLSEIGMAQYPWWLLIVTLIFTTGILNTFNFMDGINGITVGYSFSVLLGFWIVNNYQEKFIPNEFIYFTGISLIVFGIFNFRKKAICFAGDVGSISIAFTIVLLLLLLLKQSGNMLYVLFLSIYGVDSITTIIYRITLKENIFTAHRRHLYQLLANELKIPHLLISVMYSLIQLLICFIVYLVIQTNSNESMNLLFGIAVIGVIVLFVLVTRIFINHRLIATEK